MIFVDRTRVPVPAIFATPRLAALREKLETFFARPQQARDQERFEFGRHGLALGRDLPEPLGELFHHKCAYCEMPLGAPKSPGVVELFRPRTAASGLIPRGPAKIRRKTKNWLDLVQREDDRDAYWWLAYDWDNMYLACEICNRHKAVRFPVLGRRAPPGARGAALREELALLLDPCFDRPEEQLEFNEAGLVTSRRPRPVAELERYEGLDRAAITIDVLGLNRPDLVAARRAEAQALRKEWKRMTAGRKAGPPPAAATAGLLDPTRPYAGMRRDLIAQWSAALRPQRPVPGAAGRGRFEPGDAVEPAGRTTEAKAPGSRRRAAPVARPVKPVAAKPAPAPRRQRTVGFIQSIRIQNFKTIRDLTLRMTTGTETRMGWKVLLGENGSGKSSILQAVALTLMGPAYLRRYLREFRLKPGDLLRKNRGDRRIKSASIAIEFSTGQTCALKITPRSVHFDPPPPDGLFIRGYGSTRLLPRRNTERVRVWKSVLAKVTNLFDPAKPVFNADGWLTGLKNRQDFALAALALKDLLSLPGFAKLRLSGGKLIVPMNGLQHSIDELSAGYESVLVMAADIIAGNLGRTSDLRQAKGIVLLDEIDAHLHPRWKMQIVDSLRRTFSSMQFLVTTHEPLCLRGIEQGEVAVLERFGREITILEDLPAPSSMRVDQLLTSNFFGLGSTIDPVLEKEFNRYYELLARPAGQLTPDERAECDQLRDKLAKYEHRLMTGSRGEELLYQALDQYVAKEVSLRGSEREKLPALRAETRQRVASFLADMDQGSGKGA